MRHTKKSTKFQPREKRALTANNCPSAAATVITLSPRVNPDTVGIVTSVTAVATPKSQPIDFTRLIDQVQKEGALLLNREKPRTGHGQKDGTLPILSAAPATDAFAI